MFLVVSLWFLMAAISTTVDAQYLRRLHHRRINYVVSNDGSEAVSNSRGDNSDTTRGERGATTKDMEEIERGKSSDLPPLDLSGKASNSSEGDRAAGYMEVSSGAENVSRSSAGREGSSQKEGLDSLAASGDVVANTSGSSGDMETVGGTDSVSRASAGEANSESGVKNGAKRPTIESDSPGSIKVGEAESVARSSAGEVSTESISKDINSGRVNVSEHSSADEEQQAVESGGEGRGENGSSMENKDSSSLGGSGAEAAIKNRASGKIEGGGDGGGDGGANTKSTTDGRGESLWHATGEGNGALKAFGGGNVFGEGSGYGFGQTFGRNYENYGHSFTGGESFGDVAGFGGGNGGVTSFTSGQKASGGAEGAGTGFGTGFGTGDLGALSIAASDAFGQQFTGGKSFGDRAGGQSLRKYPSGQRGRYYIQEQHEAMPFSKKADNGFGNEPDFRFRDRRLRDRQKLPIQR
mmetsp:Transcript_10061/g.15418  ORF Transcript_10061/g.15418 Transcript_10061/m.15418 type:complete len:467 (-) Transcript_10061:76-1476(-)